MPRFDPSDAPQLIRAARVDAGLSQSELAQRARISQPNLAEMETGRRRPSSGMLERILFAADYRPSIAVALNAEALRSAAKERGFTSVSLFGSLLRGEDHFDSDIDMLVDADRPLSLFDIGVYAADVEEITGFPADIHELRSARRSEYGRSVSDQAVPL